MATQFGGLIGGLIGGAVGFIYGGPAGAAYGFAAGSILGGIIFPADPVRNKGPRLEDLQSQTSTYGNPIFRLFGAQRFAGNIIWSSGILESNHRHDVEDTWGSTVSSTKHYTYRTHLAVALCEGPIDNVTRIWADNELIYDIRKDAGTVQSQPFSRIEKFMGTEDQLPHPFINNWTEKQNNTLDYLVDLGFEAPAGYVDPDEWTDVAFGAAYRGLAYVFFKDFDLTNFGNRIPRFEFEVHRSTNPAYPETERLNDDNGIFQETNWDMDPRTGDIWRYRLNSTGSADVYITDGITLEEKESFELEYYDTDYLPIAYADRSPVYEKINPMGLSINTVGSEVYIYNNPGVSGVAPYGAEEANVIWTLDLLTHKILNVSFEDWTIRPYYMWAGDFAEWSYRSYLTGAKYSVTTGMHLFFSGYTLGLTRIHYNLTGRVSERRYHKEGPANVLISSNISISNLSVGGNVQFIARWLTTSGGITTTPTGHPGTGFDLDWSGLAANVPVPIDNTSWMVVSGFNKISISTKSYDGGANDLPGWLLGGENVGYREVFTDDTINGVSSFFYDPVRHRIIAYSSQSWGGAMSSDVLVIPLDNMESAYLAPISFYVDGGGYNVALDSYILIESGSFTSPNEITYRFVDPDDWSVLKSRTAGGFRYSPFVLEPPMVQSYFILGASPAYAVFTETLPDQGPLLSDVVQEVAEYSPSLETADVDVSNLAAAGERVRGYCITRQASPRTILEPLRQQYRFDMIESDWILKARHRGGASLNAVTEEDLGAVIEGSQKKPRITLTRAAEITLPTEVAITYNDSDRDYLAGTQRATKKVGNSDAKLSFQLPLTLTATEAATTALVLLNQDHIARVAKEISVPFNYLHVEPGDRIPVPRLDLVGEFFNILVTETSISPAGVINIKGVRDLPETYDMVAVGDAGENFQPVEVEWAFPVILKLLDIPLLANGDNDGIVYTAGVSLKGDFFGADIDWYNDSDNLFEDWASLEEGGQSIIGHTVGSALGNGPSTIFDEDNSVSIKLISDSHWLPNASALQVLNGANMCLIGEELLQFKDVSYESDGTWTLSGLLRGRRGTEWATSEHKSGELFVFLSPKSYAAGILPDRVLQTTQNFRASPPVNNELPIVFTLEQYEGENLRPYSPVLLDATIADGSLALEWTRRSRRRNTWQSADNIPLIESRELYLIKLLFSNGDDIRAFSNQESITFDTNTPLTLKLGDAIQFASTPSQGAFSYTTNKWANWDSVYYFDNVDSSGGLKVELENRIGGVNNGWSRTSFSTQESIPTAQCMRSDAIELYNKMWNMYPARYSLLFSSAEGDEAILYTRGWSTSFPENIAYPVMELAGVFPQMMVFFRYDSRKELWTEFGTESQKRKAVAMPPAINATILHAYTPLNWHEDINLTVDFTIYSTNQFQQDEQLGPNLMRLYARMYGENELDNDDAGISGYFVGINSNGRGWQIVKQMDWKKEGSKVINQWVLAETTLPFVQGRRYKIQFQIYGTTIRARSWDVLTPRATPEDIPWTYGSDSDITTGGWCGIASYDKEAFFTVYDFEAETTSDVSYPANTPVPSITWQPELISTDEEYHVREIQVSQIGSPREVDPNHIADPYYIALADGLESHPAALILDEYDWAVSTGYQYAGFWGHWSSYTTPIGPTSNTKHLTKIRVHANAEIDYIECNGYTLDLIAFTAKGCIYTTASDGEPDALLAVTEEVTRWETSWGNRLTFASGSNPSVVAGTDYWVGVIQATAGGGLLAGNALDNSYYRYGADTYSDGPSDPAGIMTATSPIIHYKLGIRIHFLTDDSDNNKQVITNQTGNSSD